MDEPPCPGRRRLARVLHRRHGVNTTPSVWLLGWLMLGGVTATTVCIVQALRYAALVP